MNDQRQDVVQAPPRIGLFGIGLAAYWPQFPGVLETLEGYQQRVAARLGGWGEVVSVGMVDTPEVGARAGEQLAAADIDLAVCYVGTYATSSQVLPVVRNLHRHVLILNLQPVAALDYEHTDTAAWLATCCSCAVPELAGVFQRAGVPASVVTGTLLDGDPAWDEIASWCRAAGIVRALRHARFGLLGHTYPGMLDMATLPFTVSAQVGAHVELLEIDDLKDRVRAAEPAAVDAIIAQAKERFALDSSVTDAGLRWGATVAAGLEHLAADFALDGVAYYYRGTGGDEIERIASNMILGNTLLTARGVPAAGEGDLKTAIAMKVMQLLGAGGSFSEFVAMDFKDDLFIMGHDGPADIAISDGQPLLKELAVFHGKAGGGLAIEMRARTGPITILGLTETADGLLKLIGAEGESRPGPVLKIGNSNHRLTFPLGVRDFMTAWCNLGPTHHVALGLGNRLADIERLAMLLGLPFARV